MKQGKSNRNKLIMFIFVMILLVIGALIAYYQFMKKQQKQNLAQTPATEIEKLIAKDIEKGYPETPVELMKLWGRINQCLYNNELGEEQIEALTRQIRIMYSSELLEQNEEKAHIDRVKSEVGDFRKNKNKIVTYSTDTGTSVQYKTINNKECACIRISCFITQAKGGYMKVYQDFILGKEDGKWKVIGFQESEKEPASEEEVTKNK